MMKLKRKVAMAMAVMLGVSTFLAPVSVFACESSVEYQDGCSYDYEDPIILDVELEKEGASDLPIVNEAIVTARIMELARILEVNEGNLNTGTGIQFTVNLGACGHATTNAGSCSNCLNTNVIKSNWFYQKFGYTVDVGLLPGHYYPSGNGSNVGRTCHGFVNFALWYIAKDNSTSDVYRKLVGTQGAQFTRANLEAAGVRIGDVIRIGGLGHSVMFLGYGSGNTIKVLDCNWVNSVAADVATVKIHTMSLNSSYTMAITRAVNYEPDYVISKPLTGISLSATSATLNVGGTSTLSVAYNPADTTDSKTVTWTSSNTGVATVSGGVITAKAPGTATITATCGSKSATCTVTVKQPLNSISLNKTSLALNVGGTETLSVNYNPSNTTDSKTVTWTSSNTNVATVLGGVITAKAPGTATITATCGGKSANCTVTVNKVSTPVEDFVERMYTVALGRTADPAGKANWVNVLNAGTYDGAAIAKEFILGKELAMRNLSNDAYIEVLYKTFFNRSADASGKANWLNHLAVGYSREFVLSQFVNSQEFTTLCQSFGVERGVMLDSGSVVNVGIPKFVNRLYPTVMGRTADYQGYTNWTMVLATRQQSAEQVAKSFFTYPEYLNKDTNNTTFVTDLYRTFFNREPDAVGLANWKNQLNLGMTRSAIISEFAKSAEFKAIAASYGLE